ncbi:3'(2'),5'-bisphosphate nucleotidase [Marinomonas agarivorans]|nr:3'(2'),5'-bisphosphate nucleotidase [Marinomonas agarivorans]
MQEISQHTLFKALQEIVHEASAAIMEVYQSPDFGIEEKSDNSPVTAADMAAHQIIVRGLKQLTPDIPILSEEAPVSFSERRQWSRLWVVDPLDGTKEFIKRNGEFSINIALVENHKAILGVVYLPVAQEGFFGVTDAWQGLSTGAIKWDGQGHIASLRVRQPSPNLTVMTSRSHGPNLPQELKNLLLTGYNRIEEIAKGSSIKACRIAEGEADLHLRRGPTSEWDTAASQAIVEAAGGTLTDCHGTPFTYNQRESLLNGHFFIAGPELSPVVIAWYKNQLER